MWGRMSEIEQKDETAMRKWVRKLVDSDLFRNTITLLIITNAITLGIETVNALPPGIHAGLRAFDTLVIGVFTIELMLKLFAWRLDFFKSGWNLFDLAIVTVSWLPGTQALQVLRSLRVLRVLRLLHVIPMMRRIVEALFRAIPGMGAILAVLGVLVYAGSVMSTTLFGQSDDPEVVALFGDIPASAFTLFQVMTMDGWRNEVVQKVMDDGHPYAWIFFLSFIFLASFAVLNLFIALIVDALQAEQEAQTEEAIDEIEDSIEDAQAEIRAEMKAMTGLITELSMEVRSLRGELTRKD